MAKRKKLSLLSLSTLQAKATKRGISLKNKSGKMRNKRALIRKLRKHRKMNKHR